MQNTKKSSKLLMTFCGFVCFFFLIGIVISPMAGENWTMITELLEDTLYRIVWEVENHYALRF